MEESFNPTSYAMGGFIAIVIRLGIYYGLFLGIWGFVLNGNVIWFAKVGVLVAFIISLLFAAPVIFMRKTKEQICEVPLVINYMWGNLAIYGGILGVVAWIVQLILF
jgi:hypothetical protein